MEHPVKTKTIFVTGVIALFFIGLVFIILQTKPKQPADPEKYQPQAKDKQQFPTATTSNLSHKEQIEQEIIETKGAGYTKFSLEEVREKNIIITYYGSDRMNKSLPSEKRKGPGILVFKIENGKIRKIWESIEEIYLTLPVIEIRDITGDGKAEILALWSDGNKVDALYIYSWTGDTFQLITPKEKSTSPYAPPGTWNYAFGSYAEGIKVKNLEGDKIEEVIQIRVKSIGWDEEKSNSIDEYYRQIYKWDTEKKEYYLWKEDNLGKEKPIDIDGDGIPDVIGY